MRIAISGFSGCGATTAARLVSRRLKLKQVNYTLRNLARERGTTLSCMQELALRDFPKHDLRIERKQCDAAARARNCVVASRLAVWLDDARVWKRCGALRPPRFDAKFWLDVPLKVRAKRRAKDDKIPFRDSLAFTRRRDVENALRYKRLYGVDVKKIPRDCIVIDGERNNAKQVADAIIKIAREKAGARVGVKKKQSPAKKKKLKARKLTATKKGKHSQRSRPSR
ncbi:MAG: AAA family ATPase [Candidatus Norongarragalinales archaeon]